MCDGESWERKAGYRQASLYRAFLNTALKKSVFLKHDHYVADKKRNSCIKHLQVCLKKKSHSLLLLPLLFFLLLLLTLSCTVIQWYDTQSYSIAKSISSNLNSCIFLIFKILAYLKMYLSSLLLLYTFLNTNNSCISCGSLSGVNEEKTCRENGRNTAAFWIVLYFSPVLLCLLLWLHFISKCMTRTNLSHYKNVCGHK